MRLSRLTNEELQAAGIRLQPIRSEVYVELLERRRTDRTTPEQMELRELERYIAYTAACSIIDGCCGPTDNAEWFDLDNIAEQAREGVSESVRYLDLRGLIERDPAHPGWISMRNESEATL